MSKKVPISGCPNFTNISDKILEESVDLTQQMIFAYQYCDGEKTRVLTEVWKQLTNELTDRQSNSPFVEETDSNVVHKIKTVRPIKRIKR